MPARGGGALGKAKGKGRGTVVALGRYQRKVLGMSGNFEKALLMEAQEATGLRSILLLEVGGELEGAQGRTTQAMSELFDRLWPSGLASGALVHEALEGGGAMNVRAIYLDTADVDLMRGGPLSSRSAAGHLAGSGAQTSAEYRNVIAAIASGNHNVDVYLRHEGGLSVIKAHATEVTGAPLPEALRPHLPPSFFRGRPPGGGGGPGPRRVTPRGGWKGAAEGLARLGFQLAVSGVLAYMDYRLARENAIHMRESWRIHVGAELERRIERRLPQLARRRPAQQVWLTATYRIVNEEMSNTLSDLAVMGLKGLFGSGADWAEVFDTIWIDPEDFAEHVGQKPKAREPRLLGRTMDADGRKLRIHGYFRSSVLISDPAVWALFDAVLTDDPDVDLFAAFGRLSADQRTMLKGLAPEFAERAERAERLAKWVKARQEKGVDRTRMEGGGAYETTASGSKHYF